jgi:starvation-inducible DNA-binding protein
MNKVSSIKTNPEQKSVAGALQTVLNDSHALYHLTHHCHFNVEGKHFYGLHHLFDEQYNELFTSFDVIGERIRALGEYVDFTDTSSFDPSAKIKKIASITEADDRATAMVKDLVAMHDIVIASCQSAKSIADQAKDDVTIDLMISRLAALEKAKWMLLSSAK